MSEISLEEIVNRLQVIIKSLLEAANIELIELKIGQHKKDVLIQVTADRPLGGITIQECSTLNRAIITKIDEAAFLPEDCYSLEFMSPGLDRPLKTHKDFMRNINADIHFYFDAAVLGKKEMDARLISVTEVNVTLLNKKKNEIVVPLANIIRGMLII